MQFNRFKNSSEVRIAIFRLVFFLKTAWLGSQMKTGKHVIFLGAGASFASGYPLANDLRLFISSKEMWRDRLSKYQTYLMNEKGLQYNLSGVASDFWHKHAQTLTLFRHGGFATLDEFCKLAGESDFHNEINGLRMVVKAALGIFNPEDHFEKSEYYGFVQSLFQRDLITLRDDITVLSYNYDPYLEYLLLRALEHRWKVKKKGGSSVAVYDVKQGNEEERIRNCVTSGLYAYNNRAWLEDASPEDFCVLQLHGSICTPNDYATLFEETAQKRSELLFAPETNAGMPPVLFPWELVNNDGFHEQHTFTKRFELIMYNIFSGVWKRARRAVQEAQKISFVGLSMHHFLEEGLKYLFEGKKGTVEIVLANPDNAPFMSGEAKSHWQRFPYSPGSALRQVLQRVAPQMKRFGMVTGYTNPSEGDITLVKDFNHFIRTEMIPVDPQKQIICDLRS